MLSDSQNQNSNNRQQQELASVTKMLLCVVSVFVICNTISGSIVGSLIWYGWDPADTKVFSCIPLMLNSSVNFIIYTTLGTKFRPELRNLISSWRRSICRSVERPPEHKEWDFSGHSKINC